MDRKTYVFKKTLVIGLFFAVVFVVLPYMAHGGILTLVSPVVFDGSSEKPSYLQENASEFNTQTMPILKATVNIDPNPVAGGGEILVEDDSVLIAQASPAGTGAEAVVYRAKSDQISIYEVREGDTLSQIAEIFNVTPNTIRWANDLSGSISPGQTLVILPISGIKYTVKKGDTIASIAKKYGGDADEIRLYNNISDDSLSVGLSIIIPDAEPEHSNAKTTTKVASSKGSGSSSSVPVYSGYYLRPVKGGYRSQGIHGYNAVDIAAPSGTPIYASASGTVIISREGGWNGGYGSYIVIKHDNGTQTLYAHNSSNTVAVGQYVNQGDLIGYVGNTGKSTGAHVHFEIRGAKNPF